MDQKAKFDGVTLGGNRRHFNSQTGLGLELNSPHPDNAAANLKHRPDCTARPSNLHALKDFLDFARARGMTYPDAVTRFPGPQKG
jgi:hypothetical protein